VKLVTRSEPSSSLPCPLTLTLLPIRKTLKALKRS
jgi:hypothetical protein